MKIFIFHATAGYGHKKVAEVIAKAFHDRGLTAAEVKVEDSLFSTSPFFSKVYPGLYYYSVKHLPKLWGWSYETFDHPGAYAWIKPFRSLINRMEGRDLIRRMQQEHPDHIICTHFFTAELFARAKREGKINAILTTVITDFLPHTFWVNEGTDFYWVMSEESKNNLKKRGVSEEKIVAGGIPVDPVFQPMGRKQEILSKWGFSQDRFTLLLTSGSFGLGPQEGILRALESFSGRVQCFVVCGNNQRLEKRLEAQKFSYPVKVLGFVDFMPELMEASDLIIAKSGGATTVESLAKGVPMVVVHPIPGQERRNADYLKEKNASFFMQEAEQIQPIMKTIFENPEILENKKKIIHAIAKPHAAEDLVSFILDQTRK